MAKHPKDDQGDRAFTHGSSVATSDMASDPKRLSEGRRVAAEERALPEDEQTTEKHDHLADRDAEDRQEALLDEAIEETFPGSDPISPKHIT